ncbi:MAG: prolyl oligopeptidase family serine peptidase [Clostridiaceae bacterium]|nr:prolyl oligopeptidase family serine peptidase [Clostridiaceae bacterium]
MDQLREQAESALRFTPERIEKLVANVAFRPTFVRYGAFVYKKESFNEDGNKIKTFIFVDLTLGEQRELFDHEHMAKLLGEATKEEYDPSDLPIIPEKVTKLNAFVFSLKDKSRWLYDGKALARLNPPLPQNAVISPDKKKAVYEKEGNLYFVKLPSMKTIQITQDGAEHRGYGVRYQGSSGYIADKLAGVQKPTGVLWSPDSTRFFTYLLDFSKVLDFTLIQSVPEGRKAVRPVVHTYKYALPGDENVAKASYYMFDLAFGELKKINVPETNLSFGAPINGRMSMLGWSEEGNIGACYVMNRGCKKADIYIIDPETAEAKLLFTETSDTFLFFDGHRSLNGGSPMQEDFSAKTFVISEKLGKLFWLSERDGQFDIFDYDIETGDCRRLTDGDCCVRQLLHLDDEKNMLYFSASGREPGVNIYQRYIYSVDLDSLEVKLMCYEKGDHNAFFAPEGVYYTASISAYDNPPANRIFDITDGSPIGTLCEADVSKLENIGFTYPIPFCEKGADGVTNVYGIMFLPHDFDGGKKYPVTEYYYGGNQTTRAPQTFAETLNTMGFTPCFSDLGFITVIIDGRGTPLRGKEYHDLGYNNMGDCAGLEDHVAVLEALCRRYPFIDRDRIGVWGHSGGGFAALHCITDHPEMYKVAVSTGGNHSQEIYSAEWSERYMGEFDRALWERQNAEYNVGNMTGKLLLIHGELDDNVHPASTMRVVDALIKADKDFDMLIMPNMHHTLRESDYYRRRVLEYFLRNL